MARYVVIPREDCIHEPEFSGDEATFGIVAWEVWTDVKRDKGGFTGELIDSFATEEEANAEAEKLNAANN